MKLNKTILAGSIGLALVSGAVDAQQLQINNSTLANVQIQSVSLSGGVLRLTTVGGEAIGLIGATSEPEPDPGTDTNPDAGSGSGTEPPPSGSASECVEGPTQVCGYDIDWGDLSTKADRVVVPKGKIVLSSQFTTSTNPYFYVTFQMQPPAGFSSAGVYYWISSTAGGPLVGSCGGGIGAFESLLKVYQRPRSGCVLQPETPYFLNMQHVENNAPETRIDRQLKSIGTP